MATEEAGRQRAEANMFFACGCPTLLLTVFLSFCSAFQNHCYAFLYHMLFSALTDEDVDIVLTNRFWL